MSKSTKKIILTIDGHHYDVTEFHHPGEGIKDVYLVDFSGKDVTTDFEGSHFTDDPCKMLQEAREKGECDGIKYLGKVEKKDD